MPTVLGNSFGIGAFYGEATDPADLQSFLSQAWPDITNGTFSVLSVNGATAYSGAGTCEASLCMRSVTQTMGCTMRADARTRACPPRLELRDRFGRALPVLGINTSGPTLASQVTPLGDALLNAGKAPPALSNPSLYPTGMGADALHDIKAGSNPGCDTDGFTAVQGWDAVTGLGMPDFQKLLVVVNGGSGSD